MNFDDSFADLIGNEGVYSNNPKDPGGETKYGVSKRSYPGEDIKNLTLSRAKEIYRRDFWGPAGCDALPDLVKFEMFDLAVNTSAPGQPKTAIMMLQRACLADADGSLGPKTLMAAQAMDPNRLLRRLQSLRLKYYTGLKRDWFVEFGAGVVNRVANNMWNA